MKRKMKWESGGHVPPFSSTLLLVVVLALTVASSRGSASIAISPARLEVNVGPKGATQQLTLVNRGPDQVKVTFYAGYGSQSITGAPQYFDDEHSRQDASAWIDFVPEELTLPPGEYGHVTVRFKPLAQTVATYPVLFAEKFSVDAPDQRDAIDSRMRIALPVLATFTTMQAYQNVEPAIRSMAARTVPGSERLLVDVDIVNEGTVHGLVAVQIAALDMNGALLKTVDLQTERLLPGATRRLTSEWDRNQIPQNVRFVGTLQENVRSPRHRVSSPALMALSLPEDDGRIREGPVVTSLTAQAIGDGTELIVEGRWRISPGHSSELAADIVLYDEIGQPLLRTPLGTSVESDGRGNYWLREVVTLAPQRVTDIYGVGLELWVDGVRSGYAATALDANRHVEATVSRINP